MFIPRTKKRVIIFSMFLQCAISPRPNESAGHHLLERIYNYIYVFAQEMLNALRLSLNKAGFTVPKGTLRLGMHISVDLARLIGLSILATLLNDWSSSHQLVVGSSCTISTAPTLYSLSNCTTFGIALTGGKIHATAPVGTTALQSKLSTSIDAHPGMWRGKLNVGATCQRFDAKRSTLG
jgi:hypothetical protein